MNRFLNFNWVAICDFQQCGNLTSVDSDEPVQPPFKPRNSKWCSDSSLTLTVKEYSSDKQRLWSVCAYAQAGLSLCWSHIPHCWKSHVAAQLCSCCNVAVCVLCLFLAVPMLAFCLWFKHFLVILMFSTKFQVPNWSYSWAISGGENNTHKRKIIWLDWSLEHFWGEVCFRFV